jgi:hypothetical protein
MITHKTLSRSSNSIVSTTFLIAAAVFSWAVMHRALIERVPEVANLTNAENGTVKTFGDAQKPRDVSVESARVDRVAGEPQRARTDMLVHAMQHGIAVEAEHAFGVIPGFDPQWNLYYAEFATADGPVTLYTAVNRDEPAIRYTTTWDHDHGCASPWEPVLW